MAAVTLDEVKAHLRIADTADDALLTSQLDAAEAWLVEVGVPIGTPIAAPVKQAVLLITEGFYKATLEDAALRRAVVDGIGDREFFGPHIIDANRQATINRLIAPYRENNL